MVHIKSLKFRGFKSFKRAEANFSNGYVCLAGPNGSGKSNVADGIRFALGEGSLRALRAKRVAELINTSCKFGEVTLNIEGEQKYEIKRAINPEGKTLYRINGKRSTRTLVMEELRRYGLEAGNHNIIAQGQVQKIVEMSAKERRQIIDSVAGISEFDAKKNEALTELSKVEQKITEATIVLGEREALLNELEKEKDSAISYLDAQEKFKRSKASIANAEYEKLNKSYTSLVEKQAKLDLEIAEFEKQVSVLNSRVSELDSQKQKIVSKIGSAESREAALAEIEELKVKLGQDNVSLSEREKERLRLSSEESETNAGIEKAKEEQQKLLEKEKQISSKIKSVSSQISSFEKKTGATVNAEAEIEKEHSFISDKIVSLKEQKASAQSTLSNTEKMLEMKKQEKERLSATLGKETKGRLTGETQMLGKEVSSLQAEIDGLFEREKEINRLIPDLDRKSLSLKEKAATLRATISPSSASLALKAVDQMKHKGIYGTVASLIKFDSKHSSAIEAAAGARLNYVVVEKMDTAIKAIEALKRQKSGRCTFIPLDMSRFITSAKAAKQTGCLGPLIDFVQFDRAYSKAMDYVFSGTLLFDTVQSARKAGIGKARMVTLEGELLEKSGIITGGRQKGSLLSRNALQKAETEAAKIKKDRDTLYSQLYSIREEMSAKRKQKADSEIKLKGIEIELKTAEQLRKTSKKTLDDIKQIESHAGLLQKKINETKNLLQQISESLSQAADEKQKTSQRQEKLKQEAVQQDSESQKKLQKMHSEKSSFEAKLQAKKEELDKLLESLSQEQKQAQETVSQLSSCKKSITSLKKAIIDSSNLKREKEKKLAEVSSSAKRLVNKLKDLEEQISEVAAQLGKVKSGHEKKRHEQVEFRVKRQANETRLSDLKAELDQYSGIPTIDATRQELEEIAKKSQFTMDSLGNVNLRAPELFEQKKTEIDDIKNRVKSLGDEKGAVMGMMDEIEAKKRNIFLSTFSAVNDHFKRLFSYAFPGEGTMVLEQPSSPFDGGLLVKVSDNGKNKYLDSMSGGEKSLLALMFIFSIQMHKSAPFYILDEADAALDKENSKKLSDLIKRLSANTQFIVVTHNDVVLSHADVALGVTRTDDGSKMVGVELTSAGAGKRKMAKGS